MIEKKKMNMQAEKKTRASNFELLRILSILLITLHHISMTYGLNNENLYIRYWAQFFYIGGKVGVNCFVLISSYFMVEKKFKIESVLKLHHQMIFYGLTCLGIAWWFIPETITAKTIILSIFPVVFSHYWFVTTFIGLLLTVPFLNFFIGKIDYKQHLRILIVGLFLFSIIPTFTTQVPYNDNLSWFWYLYFVGSFFRKYDTRIKRQLSKFAVFAIMWGAIFSASVIMTILGRKISVLNEGINFFAGMYILPEFIASASLFLFFERFDFQSKLVNEIGKRTLASYLIQSNVAFIPFRIGLLNYLLGSGFLWLYPIISCIVSVIVLIIAVVVEKVRERLSGNFFVCRIVNDEILIIKKMIDTIYKEMERIVC
jgi:hypothetical protein